MLSPSRNSRQIPTPPSNFVSFRFVLVSSRLVSPASDATSMQGGAHFNPHQHHQHHHHIQQQLAALLSAAGASDGSTLTTVTTSSSSSSPAAAPSEVNSSSGGGDSNESSRVGALDSLRRTIVGLYPLNSLVIAHAAPFLSHGLFQLLSDK